MIKIVATVALLAVPAALAQISARSGMIHYAEGSVEANGNPVKFKFGELPPGGQFPEIRDDQMLVTKDGRAELLLTPGAFLRVDEHSTVKMISARLTDTRLELVEGAAMLEIAELGKDNRIGIMAGGAQVVPLEQGLYEINSKSGVRVYEGKAQVTNNSGVVTLKKGRETQFGVLTSEKFNTKIKNDLYAWSQLRSAVVARANIAAATSARGSGYKSHGSTWMYYPTWGMFTYFPGSGRIYSPFGWYYYSPAMVWVYYQPIYVQNPNVGWNGGSAGTGIGNPGGYSGGGGGSGGRAAVSIASPAPSAPAPSAPAAVPAPGGGRTR
jgi:hypothetical protein